VLHVHVSNETVCIRHAVDCVMFSRLPVCPLAEHSNIRTTRCQNLKHKLQFLMTTVCPFQLIIQRSMRLISLLMVALAIVCGQTESSVSTWNFFARITSHITHHSRCITRMTQETNVHHNAASNEPYRCLWKCAGHAVASGPANFDFRHPDAH
jgi:hypothetical protein